MTKHEFVYVTSIRTTPAALWDALIQPGFTREYWGRTIESEWRVGAPVTHYLGDGSVETGTVIECDPPHRMSYTFAHDDEDLKGTRVTMTLTPDGDHVTLLVVHDGLSAAGHRAVSSGWPGVLESLKALVETGSVLPQPMP